ncbi:MAG: type II toxin-antitoxin system VapC family toxin [Actinobacteria bacterium]|nr:type II toxin-antitoxin system VapC family toxin [Actinomycetota bacterium]
MPDVVVDTDVASVLQKSRAPDWVRRHVVGARVWLTFVTVGELWKWAEVRSWGEPNRSRLDAWIAARPVIPYDVSVARWWARLAAGAQLRGRPRPQNDTWIAACCLNHGLPLLTLNSVDFTDFVDHHGLILLGDDA